MNGRTNQVSIALLLAIVTALLATMWLLFFEPPWLTYPVQPFPIPIKSVQQGDVIPMRVVRCNNSGVRRNYSIARSIVDVNTNTAYALPDFLTWIDPGCQNTVSVAHRIPVTLPPGNYRVIGISEIHGALRSTHVEWRSEPFAVEEFRP